MEITVRSCPFAEQENGWPPLVQRPSAPSRSMSECAFGPVRFAQTDGLVPRSRARPTAWASPFDAANTDAAVGGCF